MTVSYLGASGKTSYGYSRNLASELGYSLAMPKSYGTDVHLQSYLGRIKTGLAGYVSNLLRYAMLNSTAEFYPAKKTADHYKIMDKIKNYELKSPGLITPENSMYDLPSMRRAVMNLEKRLSLN
jgi:hypothetical protein